MTIQQINIGLRGIFLVLALRGAAATERVEENVCLTCVCGGNEYKMHEFYFS